MPNTDDLVGVREEINKLALDIYEFGKMHGEMGYIVSQGYFVKKTKQFLNIKGRRGGGKCSRLNECGYKHNCSHAIYHTHSEELCRQFSINPCQCRTGTLPVVEKSIGDIVKEWIERP